MGQKDQSHPEQPVKKSDKSEKNFPVCSVTGTATHGLNCSYDGVVGWVCRRPTDEMVP